MTTPNDQPTATGEEKSATISWDVKPQSKEPPSIDFYESLMQLLAIYEPADTEEKSDKQFTTPEIVQALEQHYNVPQGDADVTGIDGEQLVDYLEALGYKFVNTGGLSLQWLMKKKS
jgi:hypothetical protein